MSWYDRYSRNNVFFLSGKDALELLDRMVNQVGMDKVCSELQIRRETYYNWRFTQHTVPTIFRESVLKLALRLDTIDTMEVVVRKSLDYTVMLLYQLLNRIYDEILNTKDRKVIENYYNKFSEVISKFDRNIIQLLQTEINDMYNDINSILNRGGKNEE